MEFMVGDKVRVSSDFVLDVSTFTDGTVGTVKRIYNSYMKYPIEVLWDSTTIAHSEDELIRVEELLWEI